MGEGSAEATYQSELRKRTPLPMWGGEHYKSYDQCMLIETDESDRPSAAKEEPKRRVAEGKRLDAAVNATYKGPQGEPQNVFASSKVRSYICCDECLRPRLIFSMKAPTEKQLNDLETYGEDVAYQCGDALFGDDPPASVASLAGLFHVRRERTCLDQVERIFYNYTNVRGRTEFEWVCADCGKGPTVSPIVPESCGRGDITGYSGFAMKEGKIVLPQCTDCKAQGRKLILVGTANQVEKAEAQRDKWKTARADKGKAKAAPPQSPPPQSVSDGEEAVSAQPAADDDVSEAQWSRLLGMIAGVLKLRPRMKAAELIEEIVPHVRSDNISAKVVADAVAAYFAAASGPAGSSSTAAGTQKAAAPAPATGQAGKRASASAVPPPPKKSAAVAPATAAPIATGKRRCESGAAKRAKKKAASAAAHLSLGQLIGMALTKMVPRGQGPKELSRSALLVKVKSIDLAGRLWKDKTEWTKSLKALEEIKRLTYCSASDMITFPGENAYDSSDDED